MNIYFYVEYPYYFPHFIPIASVYKENNHNVIFILSNKENPKNMEYIAKKNNLEYSFDEDLLYQDTTDIVFFAKMFDRLKEIKATTIFLDHGIGTKSVFYHYIEYFDLYVVEGSQKFNFLKANYSKYINKILLVGFSKFDNIVNSLDKDHVLKKYDLDINKKTILYAPTFFPSSIEKMKNSFPNEFSDCNIIVKPHYITYKRSRYKKQVKKLNIWNKYSNCIVLGLDEYDITPFLGISDVMISDESSAMFEFTALNKPVISNRYYKLRLSYYLNPKKLLKRLDKNKEFYRQILSNAYSYDETIVLTKEALNNPSKLERLRKEFSKELCGDIDGKVSDRIYSQILDKINEI